MLGNVLRRERFRCVRMIYVEAEGNTPILAQRIHEAAREGRQPTKEGPIPRILIWAPRTSIRANIHAIHASEEAALGAFESTCFSLASCSS